MAAPARLTFFPILRFMILDSSEALTGLKEQV